MHIEKWKDCDQCDYHATRKSVVIGKGDVPCDVLFIGEAPGISEDVLGLPFIGKAGKLLDRIVDRALGRQGERKYRVAYTNIIACIPLVEGHTKEEPDHDCILSCVPRLQEFIDICKPKVVIAVGKVAVEWLEQGMKNNPRLKNGTLLRSIQHPSSILRMPQTGQSLAEHKCVVTINNAILDMEQDHATAGK
jgi:DNA polymerase